MKNKRINSFSILNAQFSTSQFGFTLIELLVSMSVLIVVGVIVGAILFTSLRGAVKTNSLNDVTKNGNYAIAQMTKTIRNAKSFTGVSTDGEHYMPNCLIDITPTPGAPTPTPIPYTSLKIISPDEGEITYSCSGTTLTVKKGSEDASSLLDTSVVAVQHCSFLCLQRTVVEVPAITIQFSLSKPGESTLFEQTAAASFETSVSLRNVAQ